MISYTPTESFVDKINPTINPTTGERKHPTPLPEHIWHPREFTFEALTQNLKAITNSGRVFVDAKTMIAGLNTNADAQMICTTVPVIFSPSQALKISSVLKAAKVEEATFLFESSAPSYALNAANTQSAMAEISNAGYKIGLNVAVLPGEDVDSAVARIKATIRSDISAIQTATGIAPETCAFRSVGVKADIVAAVSDALRDTFEEHNLTSTYGAPLSGNSRIAFCTSSNGLYKDGHPERDIANSPKSFAIFQIVDSAYAPTELSAAERLRRLPEVKNHSARVTSEYLNHLKVPLLGQAGTIQTAPIAQPKPLTP